MEVVFKKPCWRYCVPDGCFRASEWSTQDSGCACVLTVYSTGTLPHTLTLTETPHGLPSLHTTHGPPPQHPNTLSVFPPHTGETVTTKLAADVVYRTPDSTRYYVLLVPSSASNVIAATGAHITRTRIGLGFAERADSSAFDAVVRASAGVAELPAYTAAVAPTPQSSPAGARCRPAVQSPALDSSTGSSIAAPTALHFAAAEDDDNDEDDDGAAVTVDPDAQSVRGTVPDVCVDADTVSAQHAAVSPGPPVHVRRRAVSVAAGAQEARDGAPAGGAEETEERQGCRGTEDAAPAAATGETDAGKEEVDNPGEAGKDTEGTEGVPAAEEEEQEEEEEGEQMMMVRKHSNEDNTMEVWRRHKKHVFVVSIAGKPIYSRYGDEQNLAPFMASLSAMASFIEDTHDVLHYFAAGDHQVVFLLRGPLILVSVCSTRETRADVVRELDYVHSQIVSVLTNSSINKIFEQRPDFDLRGLLTGTDKLVDHLVHNMNYEAGFMFHALRPLVMPAADRRSVGSALAQAACPQLLFALLVHGFNLVHMARPKKFALDAKDVHLLMNFVNSSASFRMSRTWTPICLPTFDDRGFLHAFICFLPNGACLILLSAHVDAFYTLNHCADTIIAHLTQSGAMDAITRAVRTTAQFSVRHACAAPALRHFVYRSATHRQIVVPCFQRPYDTAREHKRLLRVYQRVRDATLTGTTLHANVLQPPRTRPTAAPDASASGELAHKTYFQMSDHEIVLACLTKGVELFAVFSPLDSKQSCITLANCVLTWVQDNTSDLFACNMPTW